MTNKFEEPGCNPAKPPVRAGGPPLRLALVGMSGSGKTFWTKKIAETGVAAISCDDVIEEMLAPRLRTGGFAGINGVAAWMGWPDSAAYAEREAEYLKEEIAALDEILCELETDRGKPLVLDTTGSVIYAGNHLLLRLRKLMTVVYLAASDAEQLLLIERYLSDPKPVLWRGAFVAKDGESARDTVKRCYPNLIAARRQSYAALAHTTVAVAELRELPPTADAFLALLRRRADGDAGDSGKGPRESGPGAKPAGPR
jgi:shikimate kinase